MTEMLEVALVNLSLFNTMLYVWTLKARYKVTKGERDRAWWILLMLRELYQDKFST